VVPVEGDVVVGGVVVEPVEAGGFPAAVPVAGGVVVAGGFVVPVAGGVVVGEDPVPVGIEPAEVKEVPGKTPDPQPVSAKPATTAHTLIPCRDTFKRITLLS